jgi:hypothetical protein
MRIALVPEAHLARRVGPPAHHAMLVPGGVAKGLGLKMVARALDFAPLGGTVRVVPCLAPHAPKGVLGIFLASRRPPVVGFAVAAAQRGGRHPLGRYCAQ